MEALIEYLTILLPLVFVQIVLAVVSLIHICKHPKYRFGNRAIWCIVVIFLQFFGPILYFVVGRGDE